MTQGENNDKPAEGHVVSFDHLVFWVANAKTASNYFITRLGFKPLAVRESSESRPVQSIAVRLNQIKIIFESPTTPEGEISQDIIAHGDFVKDVAFEVHDLDELVRRAKDGGAEIVQDVTEEKDKLGVVRYAVLRTYGDNTHTLIDRSKYKGILLPGFEQSEDDDVFDKLLPATHLMYVDHVEGNMTDGTLEESWTWYEKNLNMHRFWCVDYKHDITAYSGIRSASVINRDENVLLSLNEATKGLRPSKTTAFVKALGTSGVEHIALYTDDIVTTMRNLKARGADILGVPPTYYDLIREKLKHSSVKVAESIEALQEGSILIDFDERGYMLQGFTKHLQARPTLFIEIIQRRNHRGFGAMNYKWVFEAIELLEKMETKSENTEEAKNDAA